MDRKKLAEIEDKLLRVYEVAFTMGTDQRDSFIEAAFRTRILLPLNEIMALAESIEAQIYMGPKWREFEQSCLDDLFIAQKNLAGAYKAKS